MLIQIKLLFEIFGEDDKHLVLENIVTSHLKIILYTHQPFYESLYVNKNYAWMQKSNSRVAHNNWSSGLNSFE